MNEDRRVEVRLTQHAIANIREIRAYSTGRWGERVATKYLDELEAALSRIASDGCLLQPLPEISPALQHYRVNKHLIVCDVADGSVVVLAVLHVSMDLPTRLAELQPTLSNEVELLHRQLRP